MVSLDKCNGSCNNAVDDISGKVGVPSITKNVNVKVLNMITRINEAKTLIKHFLCDCKSKFDSTACSIDINQTLNNETCYYECKNY